MRSVTTVDIGARVVRGRDWEWGNQDGGGGGVITEKGTNLGWVRVKWDHGGTNGYRIGDDGKYDLYYEGSHTIGVGTLLSFKVNGKSYPGRVFLDHVYIDRGGNAAIFNELGVDKHTLASEAYGYNAGAGIWPTYRENDYAALSRLLDKLIELGVEIEGYPANVQVTWTPIAERTLSCEREPQFKPLIYDL